MRYSESLNLALHDAMEQNDLIYILGEDVCDPYGGAFKVTKGLSAKFPKRVINMPISEAAIVGVATGMAMEGLLPIVEIMFGDFITLCMDQIVNGATKFVEMFDMDIPLIIRTPMGGYRGYGPTHSQSLETLFLNVPNLRIVAPSIYHDPGKSLAALIGTPTPVLFIEGKPSYPKQLMTHIDPLAKEGEPQITLITYGNLASMCVEAAYMAFLEEELRVNTIIVEQISPILLDFPTAGKVVIAEEGIGWADKMAAALYADRFDSLTDPIRIVQALPRVIPCAPKLEAGVLPSRQDIMGELYGFV